MTHSAHAPARPSTRSRRVATGLAIVGLFLPLVWADAVGAAGAGPAVWLLPVALVLAAGAAAELGAILGACGPAPRRSLLVAGCVAVPAAAALGSGAFRVPGAAGQPLESVGWAAAATVAALVLAAGVEIAGYRPGDGSLGRLTGTALGLSAVGLPLGFLVGLRLLGTMGADGVRNAPGIVPLVALVAAAKTGDVFAYLVGSQWGRHRMAPVVSPGKTWEGAAGSILGAVVASWIVLVPLRGALDGAAAGAAGPLGGWLLHGVAVGAAGILGDLAESLGNREAGVKDSGTTLGALGGALDLVDSLLFAAPTAWLLWMVPYPS